GDYGIKALEDGWITNRQIEAARIAMTRKIKRGGKVWINVFPDKPFTKKPAEARMGKGKGSPEGRVAVVQPVRVMVELSGVAEPATAAQAADAAEDSAVGDAATEEVSATSTSAAAAPREKKPRARKHIPRSERRTRTKPARDKPATRKPITRSEKPVSELGRRQERRGVVVSDKGDKTIIVKVDVIKSHPKYKKVVRRAVKFHAHDEANTAGRGDTVRIVEPRPLSQTNRWRLAGIGG